MNIYFIDRIFNICMLCIFMYKYIYKHVYTCTFIRIQHISMYTILFKNCHISMQFLWYSVATKCMSAFCGREGRMVFEGRGLGVACLETGGERLFVFFRRHLFETSVFPDMLAGFQAEARCSGPVFRAFF